MTRSFLFLLAALPALAATPASDPTAPGRLLLDVGDGSETIALDTPAPHVTRAYFQSDPGRRPISIAFNEDATEVSLIVPEALRGRKEPIALEVADSTTAFSDGRIVFSALDAKVVGGRAKLESHPGNHRIGFWSDPADAVRWDYKPTRWGMYRVELTYSLAGGESDIAIAFGGAEVTGTIGATGSWYRYTSADFGRIYLAEDRPTTLAVRCTRKTGGAVMNLKAVTLLPAPEGESDVISAAENGDIVLTANTATVSGLKLRYEPKDIKQCLGYWTNADDRAHWDFDVPSAGTWQVELWQGCGKGHGGSEATVLVGGESLAFTVEDTGHFQKFVPRDLGTVTFDKPGVQRLEIRPKSKKSVAVMDVQKVILRKK